MNTNTEKKAIESLRTYLNEQKQNEKRLTINEMIYNDEVEEYEDSPGYDENPSLSNEPQLSEPSQEKVQNRQMSPAESEIDPQIMDMFANIRHAVLAGLQHFEKKPYSKEYDILSKLLTLVDKSVDFNNNGKQ